MLVTHAQTGLTVATIGVFIGAFSLLASGGEALSMIKKLDYKTLLFFIGLFRRGRRHGADGRPKFFSRDH